MLQMFVQCAVLMPFWFHLIFYIRNTLSFLVTQTIHPTVAISVRDVLFWIFTQIQSVGLRTKKKKHVQKKGTIFQLKYQVYSYVSICIFINFISFSIYIFAIPCILYPSMMWLCSLLCFILFFGFFFAGLSDLFRNVKIWRKKKARERAVGREFCKIVALMPPCFVLISTLNLLY